MNPGYLSYVLLLCCVIMAVFGWKNQLFGTMRRMHLFVFFVGWSASFMFTFEILDAAIHGIAIWMAVIAFMSLFSVRTAGEALLFISVMFLFASIYLLFLRLSDFYPHLVIISTPLDYALILSLFTSMMVKDVNKQLAVLSGGLFIGELMYMKFAQPITIVIGDLGTADLWWLTFLLTRVWSGAAWVSTWVFRMARRGAK